MYVLYYMPYNTHSYYFYITTNDLRAAKLHTQCAVDRVRINIVMACVYIVYVYNNIYI